MEAPGPEGTESKTEAPPRERFNLGPASTRDAVVYACEAPGFDVREYGSPAVISKAEASAWVAHMKAKRIKRIVTLMDPNELGFYKFQLMKFYERHGFKAYNVPMNVWYSYPRVMALFKQAEATGERIAAHCVHGDGRAGRVMAAWLVNRYGLRPGEAMQEMLVTARSSQCVRRSNVDRLRSYVTRGYDSWRRDAVHSPDKLPLYVKEGCPVCCKTIVFLTENGWLDKVELISDAEQSRATVVSEVGKASFPCLRKPDGSLLLESDDISLYFAQLAGKPCRKLEGKAYGFYLSVKNGVDATEGELSCLKAENAEQRPVERAVGYALLGVYAFIAGAVVGHKSKRL